MIFDEVDTNRSLKNVDMRKRGDTFQGASRDHRSTGDLIKILRQQQQVRPVTKTIGVFFAYQQQLQGLGQFAPTKICLPAAALAEVSKLD